MFDVALRSLPRIASAKVAEPGTQTLLGKSIAVEVGRIVANRFISESRILLGPVRQQKRNPERERVLQRWYRERLRELIPPLLTKWAAILGVQPSS